MIAACLSSLYGFFESHQQASHGYIEIVNESILCYSDCKPNSGFEFFLVFASLDGYCGSLDGYLFEQ